MVFPAGNVSAIQGLLVTVIIAVILMSAAMTPLVILMPAVKILMVDTYVPATRATKEMARHVSTPRRVFFRLL